MRLTSPVAARITSGISGFRTILSLRNWSNRFSVRWLVRPSRRGVEEAAPPFDGVEAAKDGVEQALSPAASWFSSTSLVDVEQFACLGRKSCRKSCISANCTHRLLASSLPGSGASGRMSAFPVGGAGGNPATACPVNAHATAVSAVASSTKTLDASGSSTCHGWSTTSSRVVSITGPFTSRSTVARCFWRGVHEELHSWFSVFCAMPTILLMTCPVRSWKSQPA